METYLGSQDQGRKEEGDVLSHAAFGYAFRGKGYLKWKPIEEAKTKEEKKKVMCSLMLPLGMLFHFKRKRYLK